MQVVIEKRLRRALGDDKSNQYVTKYQGHEVGRSCLVSHLAVEVEGKPRGFDVALEVNPGLRPDSERATFTTLIHRGVSGENAALFDKAIDVLNYDLPGKFVRDYTDKSHDVLYVTSERLSTLSQEVIDENLHHHAETRAKLVPKLEALGTELGLQEKKSLTETEEEKFARIRFGHERKSLLLSE